MNMSYCQFENTLIDLCDVKRFMDDCRENMENENLSESETMCRRQLITMCVKIADEYGADADDGEDSH